MTIDERLEALTHSVELLASFQNKNEQMLADLVESVTALSRIAHLHEQRISGLEDRA